MMRWSPVEVKLVMDEGDGLDCAQPETAKRKPHGRSNKSFFMKRKIKEQLISCEPPLRCAVDGFIATEVTEFLRFFKKNPGFIEWFGEKIGRLPRGEFTAHPGSTRKRNGDNQRLGYVGNLERGRFRSRVFKRAKTSAVSLSPIHADENVRAPFHLGNTPARCSCWMVCNITSPHRDSPDLM